MSTLSFSWGIALGWTQDTGPRGPHLANLPRGHRLRGKSTLGGLEATSRPANGRDSPPTNSSLPPFSTWNLREKVGFVPQRVFIMGEGPRLLLGGKGFTWSLTGNGPSRDPQGGHVPGEKGERVPAELWVRPLLWVPFKPR